MREGPEEGRGGKLGKGKEGEMKEEGEERGQGRAFTENCWNPGT